MNPNYKQDQTEKNELIEQALQESVGGGTTVRIGLCDLHCSIFSVNVCDFTCGVRITF